MPVRVSASSRSVVAPPSYTLPAPNGPRWAACLPRSGSVKHPLTDVTTSGYKGLPCCRRVRVIPHVDRPGSWLLLVFLPVSVSARSSLFSERLSWVGEKGENSQGMQGSPQE